METVEHFRISRRSLLLASAGGLACGRRKATGVAGYCFVANEAGRNVAAVDLSRFRVRKQIALDAAPAVVLPHPTESRVFVLAPEPGTVYEVDAATLAISRRARAGNQAVSMQLTAGPEPGGALWVLYRDPAALVEIPLNTFRPNRRIHFSAVPGALAVSHDDNGAHKAAVTIPRNGNIVLASLSTGAVERTLVTQSEPSLVAYRKDGKHLLVGSRADQSIAILDVASGKVVVRLPLPLEPRRFCFNSDEGQLFVSGEGMDAIAIIFPFTTEVAETILAGHAPDAMTAKAVAPYYLLVANPENNAVTVLDVDTRELVAVVEVGIEPRFITMTPDEEYALVLNQTSGDMAVIRILSLKVNSDGSTRHSRSAPLFTMIPVGEKPVSAAVVST